MSNTIWYKYTSNKYALIIRTQDESAGSFSGTLIQYSGSDEAIKGGFSFFNERLETVIWFTTKTEVWRLVAPYVDGKRNFDVLSGTHAPATDTSQKIDVVFNVNTYREGDPSYAGLNKN